MSILRLVRKFVALAMEFVTQRRTWRVEGKRGKHTEVHYAEFPKSWSARAERELQDMDYVFRINRRPVVGQTQLQGGQTPYHWQVLSKYQLPVYPLEEPGVQRTPRRRIMVVTNPDPTDDSEIEIEIKSRK